MGIELKNPRNGQVKIVRANEAIILGKLGWVKVDRTPKVEVRAVVAERADDIPQKTKRAYKRRDMTSEE